MLDPVRLQALHAKMFDSYGMDIEIHSLDQSTTPPTYQLEKSVKAVIQAYTPQELLSGAIPENSHRVLVLNRDLSDYKINIKSDRFIIGGKSYVPQAVDSLVRSSSNDFYLTEVRVVG